MTDFNFTNGSGVDVTFRTDLISVSTMDGSQNLTIHSIDNVDTATEKTLFANFQKIRYSVAFLKAFATTNSLTLKAQAVGKANAAPVTLVP